MKQPLELKALGIDREISSLRLWAFRIYMLMAIPSALVNAATVGTAGLIGAVVAVVVFSLAILYVISSEKDDTLGMRETAD